MFLTIYVIINQIIFLAIYTAIYFWAFDLLKIETKNNMFFKCFFYPLGSLVAASHVFQKWLGISNWFIIFLSYLLLSVILLKYVVKLKLKKTLRFIFVLNTALVLIFYIPMFIVSKGIIFPSLVLEGSMEDTFRLGDVLLCKKYYYGYSLFNSDQRILKFHEPQRSDVIDFIAPHQPQYYYLKRCIAIPGDVLEIKDKVLYLNGQLQKENYVKFTDPKILPAKTSNRDNFGPVTIKNDHIFVMGDNRDNSSDSRDWGQLDEKLIIGKVELLETADKYSRKLSVDALESGH